MNSKGGLRLCQTILQPMQTPSALSRGQNKQHQKNVLRTKKQYGAWNCCQRQGDAPTPDDPVRAYVDG